ncbi:MAG: redoxin domain-containing protein [Deltaproteobacteria bacterium]|nr:redoxin domain-containing protein [Deltaproteobacteria bacterium]
MKKEAILLIGLGVISLLLPLTGCKMQQWNSTGEASQNNTRDVAGDLVYGYNLIHVGETFPDIALKTPASRQDRSYLGIASGETFSIKDIQADMVLVEILNTHCVPCQEQVPEYKHLFEQIALAEGPRNRIKMLAVGIGNTQEEINRFREEHKIPFPMVADPRFELHRAIGKPQAPFSILVRLEKSPDATIVALTYSDVNKKSVNLYPDMMALMTLDLSVFRKKGLRTKTSYSFAGLPLSQAALEEKIKSAMAEVGGKDGFLTEFSKIAIKGRIVFSGVNKGRKGAKRLFAEVVSRPTICDVCHDVHFFYIFNEEGVVLEFVPLQLTKWGNEKWSEQDIQLMRDRLVGRFIFTSFYFNPQLDAVTSATITSVLIFDELSRGKQLFDILKQKGLIS